MKEQEFSLMNKLATGYCHVLKTLFCFWSYVRDWSICHLTILEFWKVSYDSLELNFSVEYVFGILILLHVISSIQIPMSEIHFSPTNTF